MFFVYKFATMRAHARVNAIQPRENSPAILSNAEREENEKEERRAAICTRHTDGEWDNNF